MQVKPNAESTCRLKSNLKQKTTNIKLPAFSQKKKKFINTWTFKVSIQNHYKKVFGNFCLISHIFNVVYTLFNIEKI